MRIGMDATALYGKFGGIEKSIWNLLSQLALLDRTNEYVVWVPADAPEPPQHVDGRWSWRRLPFPGLSKARRIAWQQAELPRLVQREGCDLLHSLNYVMPLACPVPVVLTVYDLIALNHSHYATTYNRLHYRTIMPQSLKRAARILVSSTPVGHEIAARVADKTARVRLVPLGVDEPYFEPVTAEQVEQVKERHHLPARYCLYVGNFEPKKNLPNLLRAFDALAARVHNAPPLVIAGGVKPWPGHEKVLGRVQLLGYVPAEDMPALFAGCEIFCFPSLKEGFGLPVLEAMACGAPVMTSAAVPLPGLDRVTRMVPPRAPEAMAQTLAHMLEHPEECRTMARAGQEYARAYTWRSHAEKTLAVYAELGQTAGQR